ncbi:dnaJ homolog subfamily B member 12-like [Sycon ciliatum]|uniref:dnaJ homolog subfamily B member 12-like n=1 Tax=Sycon ciliatum TaxID=27933 RepID=UPI0020AE9EEA|eukprot:scpid65711/ scgid18187/ DnaJ homolog subfamily B member 12
MDSNKDEALRCVDIARQHWKGGDCAKALKFIEKSVRLFPTSAAEDLGNEIRESRAEPSGDGRTGSSTEDTTKSTSPCDNGNRPQSSASSNSVPGTPSDYTQAQVNDVKRILRAKDYYDVLSVSKDASETELKKAYRKLALQFHPDKNKAPGADEAFKTIGTAFAVLRDTDKRRRYDQFGPEAARGDRAQNQGHYQHFQAGDDVTAEELFNMFFGGGYPNGNVRVHRRRHRGSGHRQDDDDHVHNTFFRQHHHHHQHNGDGGNELFRVLPLLSIFVMYLLFAISNNLSSQPYSLYFSDDHQVRRQTSTVAPENVPYFVAQSFAEEYGNDPTKLRSVERQVVQDYLETLRSRCVNEQNQRRHDMEMARWRGSQRDYDAASQRVLASCNKYHNLRNQGKT